MTEKQFLKKIKDTKFEQDLQIPISVNDGVMSRGTWNLVLSKRDCSLYSKGIKPHRNWRISDVKWYFGITGGAKRLTEQLQEFLDYLTPDTES